MKHSDYPRFPLFIELEDKPVLIVGGGKVAARRARVLMGFGASITVVAPDICADMQDIIENIVWKKNRFCNIEHSYTLIIAATDDRSVNKKIGEYARSLEIPVSVADRKEESTFWFPAIARGSGIIAGLISEDGDHKAVKEAASDFRKVLLSVGGHSSNAQEVCPRIKDK